MKKVEVNNIILSVGSKCISRVGDVMFDFANNTFLAGLGSGSMTLVGLYQASESIVGILFNLFGGVIADNLKRKKLIMLSNFLSGIICICASFVVKNKYLVYAIVIANIFLAIMSSIASPAYKAFTKEIVTKDTIPKINSYLETGSTIINVTIPTIAVVFYKALGIQGSLLLDGVSFLLSASLIFFTRPIDSEEPNNKMQINTIFKDLFEGIKYLIHNKNIFLVILLSALVNFFLAAYNLLLPYTNEMFPNFSIDLYAVFLTSEAIGGLAGALLSNFLNKNLSVFKLLLYLGISGATLLIGPFLYLTFNNYLILAISPVCFNMFLTVFNIQFFSIVQQEVDNKYLGRVFGIIFTIALLFMPIGTTVFSKIINVKQVFNLTFVGLAILGLSSLFWLLFFYNKLNRQ